MSALQPRVTEMFSLRVVLALSHAAEVWMGQFNRAIREPSLIGANSKQVDDIRNALGDVLDGVFHIDNGTLTVCLVSGTPDAFDAVVNVLGHLCGLADNPLTEIVVEYGIERIDTNTGEPSSFGGGALRLMNGKYRHWKTDHFVAGIMEEVYEDLGNIQLESRHD